MHPGPIPVALMLTSFEPGGTERQMTELMCRLDPARFRVHVACFHKRGAWLPRVAAAIGDVQEFPIDGFRSVRAASALGRYARWLRRHEIAVLHACDLYANVFGLTGAAIAGVPVRIGSRRELAPPDKTRGHLIAQRAAYRLAHQVVANSEAAAGRLRAEGVPRERIKVIPNGIDLSRFVDRPARGVTPPTITTVANLRPEKGHDVLLRAMSHVLPRHPDVRCQVVGAGPLRTSLQALARDLGVSHAVTFLGHREDVPALLASSDVFVLPSRTEAFPNSLIEAMAAGLPVVASATGGILELIDPRRNGLLVPVDDARALAAAVLEVIDDRMLASSMGSAAALTIQSRYSFDRMVHAFEDLYEGGLAVRGRTVPRSRRMVA